jgi:hypothetical protein
MTRWRFSVHALQISRYLSQFPCSLHNRQQRERQVLIRALLHARQAGALKISGCNHPKLGEHKVLKLLHRNLAYRDFKLDNLGRLLEASNHLPVQASKVRHINLAQYDIYNSVLEISLSVLSISSATSSKRLVFFDLGSRSIQSFCFLSFK